MTGVQTCALPIFFGPAKLPRPIVDRLNAEINRAMAQPDVARALGELGMELTPGTPAESAEFVRRELESWTRIVKATGVTVD